MTDEDKRQRELLAKAIQDLREDLIELKRGMVTTSARSKTNRQMLREMREKFLVTESRREMLEEARTVQLAGLDNKLANIEKKADDAFKEIGLVSVSIAHMSGKEAGRSEVTGKHKLEAIDEAVKTGSEVQKEHLKLGAKLIGIIASLVAFVVYVVKKMLGE